MLIISSWYYLGKIIPRMSCVICKGILSYSHSHVQNWYMKNFSRSIFCLEIVSLTVFEIDTKFLIVRFKTWKRLTNFVISWLDEKLFIFSSYLIKFNHDKYGTENHESNTCALNLWLFRWTLKEICLQYDVCVRVNFTSRFTEIVVPIITIYIIFE